MIGNQDSSASRTVDATTVSSSRNVRFALRKKRNLSERNRNDGNGVNISSYNSDFLSGLFADVAKANVLKELSIELPSASPGTPSAETISPPSMFDGPSSSHVVPDSRNSPRKKRRVSVQSRASCMNLLDQSNSSDMSSPTGIDEISSTEKKNQDSLAYQLNCLDQEKQELVTSSRSVSPANKSKKVSQDVAALAFPNLPTAVSDSSCESNNVAAGLTRERCLIQHGSAPEITASGKESFGWFVDLDDNQDFSPFNGLTKSERSNSCDDLAFKAPTAPKQATDHVQEEMEQAYAADTIDSVLGDFF